MLKIAIIHGDVPVDGINKDGEITFLTTEKEEHHIINLVTYLKNHFKDDEALQKLEIKHCIESAATIFIHRGDVIFLDTTKHPLDPNRINKQGSLICPEKITKRQRKTLTELESMLLDYSFIDVEYDSTNKDGFLSGLSMSGPGSRIVGEYLEIMDTREQKQEKNYTIKRS